MARLLLLAMLAACTSGRGGADPAEFREERATCPGRRPVGMSYFWPTRGTVSLPTAIVVVGGQRWDRYGDLQDKRWGHYRQIAQALAKQGAAAVLFDKGGTGETGGPPADLPGRIGELVQVAGCVRERMEVGELTLIGHSQGASVVVAAASEVAPRRLVLLSPGTALGELPEGMPVTVIQAADEAIPSLRPITFPGVNHLLIEEPATPGVSKVAPEVLATIARVVNGEAP